MTDCTFKHHVKVSPVYGPNVDVDSCSDGSIWIRMEGNGLRGSSMLTAAQASELSIALRDALFAVGKPMAAVTA